MSPALFALVVFQIGSRIFAQAGLDHDPSVYVSHVAGITGSHHHIQLYWLK
jgi:hypothetical protein